MSGFVIDTPEGIAIAGVLQITHRLALEINTGLKSRVNTLAVAQKMGFTTARTRKGALKDMVALLQSMRSDYIPSASIERALSK